MAPRCKCTAASRTCRHCRRTIEEVFQYCQAGRFAGRLCANSPVIDLGGDLCEGCISRRDRPAVVRLSQPASNASWMSVSGVLRSLRPGGRNSSGDRAARNHGGRGPPEDEFRAVPYEHTHAVEPIIRASPYRHTHAAESSSRTLYEGQASSESTASSGHTVWFTSAQSRRAGAARQTPGLAASTQAVSANEPRRRPEATRPPWSTRPPWHQSPAEPSDGQSSRQSVWPRVVPQLTSPPSPQLPEFQPPFRARSSRPSSPSQRSYSSSVYSEDPEARRTQAGAQQARESSQRFEELARSLASRRPPSGHADASAAGQRDMDRPRWL